MKPNVKRTNGKGRRVEWLVTLVINVVALLGAIAVFYVLCPVSLPRGPGGARTTLPTATPSRPKSATPARLRPTPTPLYGVGPAEKAAIEAVQQYTVDGSNTVRSWLSVTLAAKKAMGDNIDLADAYWSARENGQRFQVRFSYKEDGRWQYAEWRYVPSTGLVFGENWLGQMAVR